MTSNSPPITIFGPARDTRPAFAGGVLLLLVVAAGCGGRDSAASRSAAEFDRAQQKGGTAATTDGAHGGHGGGQEPQPDGAEAKDSGGAMAGMDHANMPGMKPPTGAATQGGAMAGMDHSNMPGMKHAGTGATPARPMAGMDHANMPGMKPSAGAATQGGAMAGMDHSNMSGRAMAPPLPERPSVSAQPGQPAATLRPGELDLPAPTSVRDAARSAAMAQEMAGGGHGGMTHGTYSQTDAGRDTVAPSSPGGTDPHRMHGQPASPRPQPSPGTKENNR